MKRTPRTALFGFCVLALSPSAWAGPPASADPVRIIMDVDLAEEVQRQDG